MVCKQPINLRPALSLSNNNTWTVKSLSQMLYFPLQHCTVFCLLYLALRTRSSFPSDKMMEFTEFHTYTERNKTAIPPKWEGFRSTRKVIWICKYPLINMTNTAVVYVIKKN